MNSKKKGGRKNVPRKIEHITIEIRLSERVTMVEITQYRLSMQKMAEIITRILEIEGDPIYFPIVKDRRIR